MATDKQASKYVPPDQEAGPRSTFENTDPSPVLSVIIVNWNSKDYVRQCLTSFYKHCRSVPFEVIVVDGASFDGCDAMLAAAFPAVRFIQSPDNVGFARANNLGAKSACGEYLLLLNPDTLLLEDSPKILIDALTGLPNAGAVGCRLLNRDRSLQTSCVQAFPTVFNQVFASDFLHRRFPHWRVWGVWPLYASPPKPEAVEVISGACMLFRRSQFEAVGGFTESYFMYAEDLDLCFKVRASGRLVYYTPATSIVHFGGGSTDQAASNFSNVMMRRSVHAFMRLHRGPLAAAAYRAGLALSALIRVTLIGPLLIFGNRIVRHGTDSWRKWFAILRWSLGLDATGRPAPAHTKGVLEHPASNIQRSTSNGLSQNAPEGKE